VTLLVVKIFLMMHKNEMAAEEKMIPNLGMSWGQSDGNF
jgi:hypothetical protein